MTEFKDNTLINKIVQSNSIVDIIGSYINLEHKGKNFFGVCPFHDDHKPSMSVSTEKNIFKCFSCGASGNSITFLMDYLNISFKEALKILADNAGIVLDERYTKKRVNKEQDEYFKINNLVSSVFKNNLSSSSGKEAREYLNKRHLDEDVIKHFNIGLALSDSIKTSLGNKYEIDVLNELDLCKNYNNKIVDTFVNRIIFPIKDIDGNIVGFTGRVYKEKDSQETKYLNTKETKIFRKGSILYNYSDALEHIRKKKEIIICEGQMDTIRLYTIGIKNSVSLSGTSFTNEQISLISKLKCVVVLNLDQDNAGKTATYTIGNMLESLGIKVKVIVYGEYKDCDELIVNKGSNAFLSAYDKKQDFINFKLSYLKKGRNLKDSVELSKYINEVLENLNKLNDSILIELKIKELSEEYGISVNVLKSKIIKKIDIIKPKIVDNKRVKYNRCETIEMRIIYLMLNHEDVIKMYENNLGFLVNERYTNLANEIVNFKIKNKSFSLSDFITYALTNELNEVLKEVLENGGNEDYTEEELEDLIKSIQVKTVDREINKLKIKIKNSLDEEEKKKMTKKIENMRKELLTWYKK